MKRPWRGKVVAAILLSGGLGVPALIATAHGLRTEGTYVTTDPVDVKAGPSEGYETVRRFRKGTIFEIVGKEGAWLKIQLAEHEARFGYVDRRYAVAKDQPARLHPRPAIPGTNLVNDQHARVHPRPAIPGTYLATKPVNVRLGPGQDYAIVSVLPKDTRIVIVDREGEWLRIATRRGDPPAFVERKSTFLEPAD